MEKQIKNVLSCFDGMSCGQIALNRLGVKYENYYAAEIDKHAIAVTKANYPNTIHLGDVTKWNEWQIDWSSIDLFIGGSPCQGFSFAGKQLNFDDPRSKLFFVYADILNHIKKFNPNVKFLLENVKMKKEYENIITEHLGVNPIEINSALVSAQNRKRLYWTNIEGVCLPEDKGILLRDIVHENNDEIIDFAMPTFNINPSGKGMNGDVYPISKEKSNTLTTNKGEGQKISVCINEYIVPFDKTLQILDKEVQRGKIIKVSDNYIYKTHNTNVKLFDITGTAIRNQVTSNGVEEFLNTRIDQKSNCVLGSFSNKLNLVTVLGCITPDRVEKRQNGQRFSEGKKFYTLTAQDKHGVLIEGYIRKLTPIECERLQTVPDNYTNHVSNSQRYRMLGNGWTVDVIVHILKNLFAN